MRFGRTGEEVRDGNEHGSSHLSPTAIPVGWAEAEFGRHEPQNSVAVVVREHKGVLHEVLVVPGGFCLRRGTYDWS